MEAGLSSTRLALAGQLVGGLAGDLLRRVGRAASAVHLAAEAPGHGADATEGDARAVLRPAIGAIGLAFRVVGVGGEAESGWRRCSSCQTAQSIARDG
jgi:hypothetical protein